MADKKEILSRVVSSFKGLSTGDAVGKQTETLSREDILKWYPEGVKGFHGRIGDVIPRYVDGPYKWRIGETTDDTEQTMAVAKAIIKEGRVSHSAVGQELLLCKKSNHPSLAIWRFQQHYFPSKTAIIMSLAIALSLVTKSVEQTILLAVNLGGDTDTVASIGGAIAGAMFPDTVNEDWYRSVVKINGNELLGLVESLVSIRC